MKVTTIRRVKRVGQKWKTVSVKQYIAWRPDEMLLPDPWWIILPRLTQKK